MNASTWNKAIRMAAVLAGCLVLASCSKAALYSHLDEQQANQVMAKLLGSGIDASKDMSTDKVSWEISIPRSEFPRAMALLDASGLPRRKTESMGELFKKEGFASSQLEEKARYVYGLEEGMRQKLLKVPGVVDAEVSIAMPDRDPLSGDSPDSSASVMIFQQPGMNLADRETDLKVYIKDGIAGLGDVNKVTIKFFGAGTGAAAEPAKRAQGTGPIPVALSSISPLTIGIAIAVALLLGLLVAFGSRLRTRLARPKTQPPTWNG